MPIAEWEKPMTLTSPAGTMQFNVQTASGLWLLVPSKCKLRQFVRAQRDLLPQADGAILHRRYLTGSEMELNVELWEDNANVACEGLAVTMLDTFMMHMRALLNAGDNEGRIVWQVTGQSNRMLDDIRLWQYPVEEIVDDSAGMALTCVIDTEYPYSQGPESTTALIDNTPTVITNAGSATYMPVFKVYGPTNFFTITNTTTGEQFEWDGNQPGAPFIGTSDYAEINMFRNTIFLNGDEDNLNAGIVMLDSLYFGLQPGNNTIEIDGADADLIWHSAYA